MKDKEARQTIRRLEERIEMLECQERHEFNLPSKEDASRLYRYFTRSFHKISIKQVVEAILEHLELEIGFQPGTSSKAVLKKLEDTND